MKTRTSIYHRTFAYALLIAIIFCSCNKVNTPKKNNSYAVKPLSSPLVILEVDNCEYLFGDWGYATVLTHKGNCKFCTERSCVLLTLNLMKMDIQTEVQKIHHQFGVTEKANYEIQKLFDKLILEDRAKQLRIADVAGRSKQLKAFAEMVANDNLAYLKDAETLLKEFESL